MGLGNTPARWWHRNGHLTSIVVPVLTLLVSLPLFAVGIVVGVNGTAVATVDPPPDTGDADIEVATEVPEGANSLQEGVITVRLFWLMNSVGRVEVSAFAYRPDEARADSAASPTTQQAPIETFYIFLYCGARMEGMQTATSDDETGVRAVTTGGSESDCRAPQSLADQTDPSRNPAYQRVEIRGNGGFDGVPCGKWTDTSAGQRIARTPVVSFLYHGENLMGAASSSIATAELAAAASESLETYSPVQLTDGSVLTDTGRKTFGPRDVVEYASIGWETESRAPLPNPQLLLAGFARWNELVGEESAQNNVMWAGVLLGLAAALAVDGALGVVGASLARRHNEPEGHSGRRDPRPSPRRRTRPRIAASAWTRRRH